MGQRIYLLFLIALIMLLSMALLVACSMDSADDDDDDDDSIANDEDLIRAVLTEMIEGRALRTKEALDEKIYIHISEDYKHAGQNKQAAYEDDIKELENNYTTIDEYDLTIGDILIEDSQAEVEIQVDTKATLEPNTFAYPLYGVWNSRSTLYLQKEAMDAWLVTGDKLIERQGVVTGGEEESIVDLSDISFGTGKSSALNTVSVSGSFFIEAKVDNNVYSSSAGLNWSDEKINALYRLNLNESAYIFEPVEGESSELDITLPDDGEPAGIKIPGDFEPGVDAIRAEVQVSAIDEGEENPLVAVSKVFKDFPLSKATYEVSCDDELASNIDGTWLFDANMFGSSTPMIADLAQVGDLVFGAVGFWASSMGEPTAVLQLVQGEVDGENIVFGVIPSDEMGHFTIEYSAKLNGTDLENGDIWFYSPEGFDMHNPFTASKLGNRCEYLNDDNLPESIDITWEDSPVETYTFDYSSQEVTVTGQTQIFSGVFWPNLMLTLSEDGYSALLIAFNSSESGFALRADLGEQGEF